MKKHYQYIIFILILVAIYELYLIFSFKYVDIEKDYIITNYQLEIAKSKKDIQEKKDYFAYINTAAYKDKIAKLSQNKKNPEEEVIFLVSKDEIDVYSKLEDTVQKFDAYKEELETFGMTNWQKWIYYVFGVDVRD